MLAGYGFRETREGLQLSVSKTPRTEGGDKVKGSVDPRIAAGFPFPVPEILRVARLQNEVCTKEFLELRILSRKMLPNFPHPNFNCKI